MLGATGCNQDRLDVEPVNEFLSANFYQTEDQVFSALVAAYDPLGWTMAYGNWISSVMFGEIRSDNANAGGDPSDNDQPGWQEFDDFRNTNTNRVTHPIYRRNYIGIFRANLVISNAQISTPLVERFQAEAKFLRAYYHFELFKHFGPIPVVTETLTPDDVDRSRNTMSEVFEAITTHRKGSMWGLFLLRGVINVGFGVALLLWSDITLSALVWLFGLDLVITAIVAFVLATQVGADQGRSTLVLRGAVSLVFGIMVMAWPSTTLTVLAILVGIQLILFGLLLLFSGWQLSKATVVEAV